MLLNNLGDVLTHLGCYGQAAARLNEALALARRLGNIAAQASVFEGLSRVARACGDQLGAETYARRALSPPDNRNHGWQLTTLGKALEGQGRLSEAAEAYQGSVRWWERWADTDPILEAHAASRASRSHVARCPKPAPTPRKSIGGWATS